MKKFEKPSLDECKNLVVRIKDKTLEQMIEMFGPPARERGARTDRRMADGVPWVVEIRRELIFRDIGPTIRTLFVTERMDGKCEFNMRGKENAD